MPAYGDINYFGWPGPSTQVENAPMAYDAHGLLSLVLSQNDDAAFWQRARELSESLVFVSQFDSGLRLHETRSCS
jgi:hypothetical protein